MTKTEYSAKISSAFGEMGVSDVNAYLPNDRGVELLANTTMKITKQVEMSYGVVWSGKLTVNGVEFLIEDEGNGGALRYETKGGWEAIDALEVSISDGFDGLTKGMALDLFPTIVEIANL